MAISATTRRTSLGRNGFSITGRPLSETNSRKADASVSPVTKTTRAPRPWPALFDLLVERAAVEIGHPDVRQDRIVAFQPLDMLERFASGSRLSPRGAARRCQDVGERLTNLGLVVDDQYRALAHTRFRILPRLRLRSDRWHRRAA